MKKLILVSLLILVTSYVFSQDKKDKKLIKNIENVSKSIGEIKKSIDIALNKKISKTFYKKILSKKELSVLDSDISRSEKLKYIDTIVANARKDKTKYMMLSMVGKMQNSMVETEYKKLMDIFKNYGYLSRSRLNGLNLLDRFRVDVEKLLLDTPKSQKNEMLQLIKKELEHENLNQIEFETLVQNLK